LLEPDYPPAPDGFTVYAVGDIHGRADLLDQIHDLIDRDKTISSSERNVEVYLGDYIDRGADSATVISRLIKRSSQTRTIFLRGNHEQLLLDFLNGKDCWSEWKTVGCSPSCLSYGISPNLLFRNVSAKVVRQALQERVPSEHIRFYEDTSSYCCLGSYLFVHAGIRPGIKLEDQNPSDLLNIRQSFLKFEGDLGYMVIHGHTPVESPDLRKHRINIDTGAFATNRLTCLRIDCDGVWVLTAASDKGVVCRRCCRPC
jgi:serine/threonine protein phosphatase 1